MSEAKNMTEAQNGTSADQTKFDLQKPVLIKLFAKFGLVNQAQNRSD